MSDIQANINIDYDALLRVEATVSHAQGGDAMFIKPEEWTFTVQKESQERMNREGERVKFSPGSMWILASPKAYRKIEDIDGNNRTVGEFTFSEDRIFKFEMGIPNAARLEKIELPKQDDNIKATLKKGWVEVEITLKKTAENSPHLAIHRPKDGEGDRLFQIKLKEKE